MIESPLNIYETRVRIHQTDFNAAMYHGAYFDLFDDARIEMFRRMGYTYQRMIAGEWTAVVRRMGAEFYAPAWMDDRITVVVGRPTFSRATMAVEYRCLCEQTLLAAGNGVYAFLNRDRRPLRVPADVIDVVEQHASLFTGPS